VSGAGPRRRWSRWALVLGVVSLVGAVGAVFYGASIAVALLALLFAVVGRVRGERSLAAFVVPLLGVVLGVAVYAAYLRVTEPDPSVGGAIEDDFADNFDQSFNALLGDASAGGFGDLVVDAGVGGSGDGASDAGAALGRSD